LDQIAIVTTEPGLPNVFFVSTMGEQKFKGSFPSAMAQSADGKRLFVADASLDAVAVFDMSWLVNDGPFLGGRQIATGFIPTDWYPSALAVQGNDLIIATAKGEGARANKDMGKTSYEMRHRDHPYIPTLIRGSAAYAGRGA
jgi:sugar lactone lactonase YvrE